MAGVVKEERRIRLRKQITVADPVSGTVRLQLTVVGATGIQREIFVIKYTPANALRNAPTLDFNNVAYADELTLPIKHGKGMSRYLDYTFCKDFASLKDCETFLKAVAHDIQRLLMELNIFEQTEEAFDYFDVTADYIDCTVENPEIVMPGPAKPPVSGDLEDPDNGGSGESESFFPSAPLTAPPSSPTPSKPTTIDISQILRKKK